MIARHLARVLSGGAVPAGAAVSEQHILDLEREAFLSLCGEPKTRDRIQHMLAEEQTSSELRDQPCAKSPSCQPCGPPSGARRAASSRTPAPTIWRRSSSREALRRAEVEPATIEDVVLGCAQPEAEQGLNVARQVGFLAGLPDEVPAMTINRFCSSGLQAAAIVADRIAAGGIDAGLAGGLESMSLIPMGGAKIALNPAVVEQFPDAYIPMGNTAENVARQFGVSRGDQDAFALASHQKAVAAQDARRLRRRDRAGEDARVRRRGLARHHRRQGRGAARRHVAGEAGGAEAGVRSHRHASPPATRRRSTTARRRSC